MRENKIRYQVTKRPVTGLMLCSLVVLCTGAKAEPIVLETVKSLATSAQTAGTGNKKNLQLITNLPPEAKILFPPDGVTISAILFNIRAWASDPDGSIKEVRFYYDEQLIGVVTNSPYTLPWIYFPSDLMTFFKLSVVAVDNLGTTNMAGSNLIHYVNFLVRPNFFFTAPVNSGNPFDTNSVFAAPASFTMSANLVTTDGSDNPPLFYLGTNLVGVAPGPPYSVVASNIQEGQYLLRVATTNAYGELVFSGGGTSPQYVTVVPLLIERPHVGTNQGFEFRTSGHVAGKATLIEASTNLISWQPIATNTPGTNSFLFLDPKATNYQRRFYRASFTQ